MSESYPHTLSNPPPESSKISPSSAQPPPPSSPPHDYDLHSPSLTSPRTAPEVPPEVKASYFPPETPTSIVPPEIPTSDVLPETPASDVPPKTSTSDVPPEFPISDVSPEIPTSDVPSETPDSDVPPEILTSPPEIPTSDVPPETPAFDVRHDIATSDVSLEIPPLDVPPEIPTSDVPLEIPASDVSHETPSSDIPPEIPTPDVPPETPASDAPHEIPTSDIPPEIPTSDAPAEIPTSDVPHEVLSSDTPPEIPTSHTRREFPPSDVLSDIPTSSVPPPIPLSDTPPPIRPSELLSETPPSHHLPPKIPKSHLHVRSEIPRSYAPPEIVPSDVPAEESTSEIQNASAISESRTEISRPLSYQTHSFTRPEHKQLKYTLSTPAVPYQADDQNEDSALPAKYSPRTRSPSDGSDVRWYFCKTPLRQDETAASVPSTELVGKGEYFRFSKGDSDALEAAFLEREEELVRAWWKEYAESRDGPSKGHSSYDAHSGEAERVSQTDRKDFESSRSVLAAWEEEGNVGVLVKGGLYEVDLLSRRCLPVYWRGDHRRVLRGHWFARKGGLDWLPLREDLSEQLEIAYESQIWRRRRFQPSGLYAARVNLHGATLGLHALFTGEDDSWEAWLCVDTRGISFVLGLRGSGVKLRRGFALPEAPHPTQDELRQHKEEEMDDYASKVPVRHVVFMVHGIGQRLEKANLVDDVGAFRRTVAMLAEQHLTQYQRDSQRVLFIPCQWRRELKLGGESSVEDCTLEGVRALRTMLSATVHDVLYYMSPVYCQDIIDSVSQSLNRLYRKFIKRNPNYDGKVSIYGHSLGTVLSYDILCHQTRESATSTAPIAEFKPDEDETQDDEADKSSTSTPTDEVNVDVSNNSEEVPSRKSSDIENGYSSPEDSDGSSSADNFQKIAAAEKNVDIHSSNGHAELEYNAEKDDTKEKKHSEELSQVPATEVEALKAEVKMLQEQLSALMQEKSPGDKSSSPLVPTTSLQHTSLERSKIRDSQGPDGQGASSEELLAGKELPSADPKEIQFDSRSSSRKSFTPYISYTKLQFEVDTFFSVGSPLGVFLSLRNIRIGEGLGQNYWKDDGIEEEMPAVRRMMNIFHPYDPVAYRIEPLICREFVKKRPEFIPYHKGGKRLHIGMQEFQEDLLARRNAFVNRISSVGSRVAHSFFHNDHENKNGKTEVTTDKTYGKRMMERLTGPDGRLDYQLQDSTFEHPYIAVLSSHTSYWHDLDTALFILKQLYRDIPEEPPAPPPTPHEGDENVLDVIDEDSEVPVSSTPDAAEVLKSEEDSDSDDIPLTFTPKEKFAVLLADANKVKPNWIGNIC